MVNAVKAVGVVEDETAVVDATVEDEVTVEVAVKAVGVTVVVDATVEDEATVEVAVKAVDETAVVAAIRVELAVVDRAMDAVEIVDRHVPSQSGCARGALIATRF